jgi:predicted CoA-binding protein
MSSPSVAVVGASQDRRKFGNKAVRAYLACGMTVFPVNPRETMIEGLVAYPSLDAIEAPLDYVSLYLPPAVGLQTLPAIARKNPREVWLNPGAESEEFLASAQNLRVRAVVGCSIVALGRSPAEFPDS